MFLWYDFSMTSKNLKIALVIGDFSPDGGVPEDIDHIQPVGMGRKRWSQFDDSDLRGLSHKLHVRRHTEGEKAFENLPHRYSLSEVC